MGDTRVEIQLEVEKEYQRFLKDIKDSGFVFDCYMDEAWYEDNHSHNSIGRAMEILERKIREYLHKNRPDEFVVYSDWSVHIMKKEKAEEIGMRKSLIESGVVR